MNRLSLVFLALLVTVGLAFTPQVSAQSDDYSYVRVVRLSLVEGQVQIAHADSDQWEQAVVNMPLRHGDTIATAEGRAEIEFESGATARLAENSELQFTELALSDGGRITRLKLTQGTATFYANLASKDSFVVETPGVIVSVPENARFRVDAYPDGSAVIVLKGSVDVNSTAGTHRVSKGSTLSYRTDNPDEVTMARNADPDAWDKWVADRDEVVQNGTNATLQYVNSPNTYGYSDLYTYGSWYPVSGYGMGWRPYGATLSWTPFMTGAWGYYTGCGWVWTSYEPWGWLPYHYGGWVFSPALGWLWVPSQVHTWRPAVAVFVQTGGHVGWVPQHPHDRPGATPTNLRQGFVVTNTNGLTDAHRRDGDRRRDGPIGTRPYTHVVAPGDARVDVINAPPRDFAGRHQAPPAAAQFTAHNPASPWRNGGANGNNTPTPSSTPPAIVYDQRDRRWVNNPNAPVRHRDDAVPTMTVRPPQSQPAPQSGQQPNSQRQLRTPADSPDRSEHMRRPESAPQPAPPRPATEAVPQRQSSPPPPPPGRQNAPPPPQRQFTPPPPAPPRTESPRPASPPPAPPRTEAPRPTPPPPPAPHVEPSRPTPSTPPPPPPPKPAPRIPD